jgi:hypothetical protein
MAGIMRRTNGKEEDPADAIVESPQISTSGSMEPVDMTEKDAGISTAVDTDEEGESKIESFRESA